MVTKFRRTESHDYDAHQMEWNTLLLWLAGPSCLITLITAVRASPVLKGWIGVSLLIVGIGFTTYFRLPEQAGYITGGLWAVLILSPSLLQRTVQRWTLRQQFDRAAKWARVAGWLHPFDGVREQAKFCVAMRLAERGDTGTALLMLDHLQTAPPRLARAAKLQRYRLTGDWAGLVNWVRIEVKPAKLLKDASLLPMYVRALGETGALSEMLDVIQRGKLSLHPMMAPYRAMCRLYAFAFCGQSERAAGALDEALSTLPDHAKQYWIATAELAAGMTQAGDARLDAIEPLVHAGTLKIIRARRANPPPPAAAILTADDQETLHQMDLEHDQERRYAPSHGRAKKPWVTYALITANVVMFTIESATGGTTNPDTLYRLGAMVPDAWRTHEYIRLLAANFLHFGPAHILMNMLGLLVIGPFVEFNLGWLGFLLLYLLSGVLTMMSMAGFWALHWTDPDYLVGASGAIMALIGATAAVLLRGWFRERARAAHRRLVIIAGLIALQATFDHLTPQVSGAAHMVGVAWGLVLASVLPHRNRVRPTRGFEIVPVE